MKVLGRLGFVFIGLLLLIPVLNVVKAESEISLSATTIRPGDFVRIKVKAPHGSLVRTVFRGVSKTLLEGDNGTFFGLIAASYYTTPDVYPLGVEIVKDEQVMTSLYQIQVIARKFPESRVVMDEAKRKKILTTPNRESDTKKTQEARKKVAQESQPPLWNSAFIWPVKGAITTEFGFIRYVNNIDNGRHSGLDIAANTGTPVLACNDGIVVFSGNLYLTGFTVIVYHGLDLFSSYAHLSALKAYEGDKIAKGDLVGLVGSTGLSTGPHLHLTFRVGETPVDPRLFLEQEVGWEF